MDRVGFGVQSREPKVLAGLQRKDRFQIFLERSHLHNSGVVFDAQFIYGLPFETITSLRRGIDRTYTELSAHSIRNVEPRFFRLSVLPGTEFDGRRADLGYVVDDFHFSEITQSKWMSCRDVEEARLLAVFCMSVLNRRIRSERGGCLAGGSAVELWNAFRGWLNEKHSVNDLHDLEQSELDLLREFENFEVSYVR